MGDLTNLDSGVKFGGWRLDRVSLPKEPPAILTVPVILTVDKVVCVHDVTPTVVGGLYHYTRGLNGGQGAKVNLEPINPGQLA